MKPTLILLVWFFALNLTAQEVVVEYPYNPDFENDGNVGVEDLLQLLSSFGMAFEVGELTIDEVVLSEWLQTISETLIAQQAMIDSLSSLTSALDSAGVADLLSQANFGTSAGGFNPRYPVIRGTHDLRFNTAAGYSSYTVPTDSIFIIEHAAPSGSAGSLFINGIAVWSLGFGLDSRPLQQLYVGPGETVTSTQGITWNIHGYLVPNESIIPLTIAIPGQESYTVPAGKQFVISTINGDATGSLQIDNVYRGSYSTAGVQAGLNELYVPLVCSSSTTLFMNNNPDKTARINGYLVDEDYFESSSPSVASEAESLGLAFGEKEFWDLDGFEWLPIDFPQMDVTFIEAQTDGILHVDGTTVAYPPYGLAVVPSDLLPCDDFGDCDGMTIALIFMGDDFENYQYNSFSYADAAPVTIAVKEGEVICLRKNSNTASWQRFIWVPIVSDSSAYNEPVNQGPYSAISDTLIIDVGDQYSDWYGSPVPFAAEKPFVKFVGQAPVNPCYFELANPNDSVPDVVIFNASENIVRGNTFTGGNYLVNNEWIHLRAVGDQWFKPWYDH